MESKFSLAGLTEKCPDSSWEQLSPFLPGGGSTGSPGSFADSLRQGQAVPGWQQLRQSSVRTRNHNPNIYSSTVYPYPVSSRGLVEATEKL